MSRYDEAEETIKNARQWQVNGNEYQLSAEVASILPAGVYSCAVDGWDRPILTKQELHLDELISFPATVFGNVIARIRKFWTKTDKYEQYGFLHKLGFLLWGRQGCGKSSLIHQIANEMVSDGNVVFMCDANVPAFVTGVRALRQLEPDRPLVCVFEDIDTIIEGRGEGALLQWLDGADKTNHVVALASTNYPEKLDKRVIARPRRFDRVLHIGAPDEEMRRRFFSMKMLDLTDVELQDWVNVSDNLSFAALADLVISVKCMDNDLVETAKLLKRLEESAPSSEDFLDG